MDWGAILLPAGILLTGIAGFFMTSSARYFTIREQEAFTRYITREFDQLHQKVTTLEQTRPTTGELKAMLEFKNGKHEHG